MPKDNDKLKEVVGRMFKRVTTDLIIGILTIYLISLDGLASFCGILILLGEVGAIIYSVSQVEFKFLIVYILTNGVTGSNGK